MRTLVVMGKPFKPSFMARLRAAWAVLRAERAVVIAYDPSKPPNILGKIHTGISRSEELPERLANACLVAVEYDKQLTEDGQHEALHTAREILGL